jgi:EmrB/QacA subfamily drug resistance transporter
MVNHSQQRLMLAVLSLAAFMAGLDMFIVNVAFADIGRSFDGESLSNLSWVLNGYAIVYAALLVPAGRLADRFGRKAGFLLGVSVFTVASVACALSTSLWMLVAFRVLQAVGAAALTPTSLGLILSVFPPERRAGAVRVWSASAALAAAAGPVVGGLLVSASWRWVFEVNLPIGIIALVAAAVLVPDSRDTTVTRTPDLAGAAVLTLSIGVLSLALVKVNDWSAGRTTVLLATAGAGLLLFARRSLHHPSPVVEPALLRVTPFVWSNVTVMLFSLAFAANLLAAVLWMQDVWGYSALRTGLGIAPGPSLVPVFAVVAGRVANRLPVGWIAATGCLACAVGLLALALSLGQEPHYASDLLPGLLIFGVGVGLALPTILSAATTDLPDHRFATGSAFVNMNRQIGSVLGISLLVAVMGTPRDYPEAHSGFLHSWTLIGLVMVAAAAAALCMNLRGRSGGGVADAPASGHHQHHPAPVDTAAVTAPTT